MPAVWIGTVELEQNDQVPNPHLPALLLLEPPLGLFYHFLGMVFRGFWRDFGCDELLFHWIEWTELKSATEMLTDDFIRFSRVYLFRYLIVLILCNKGRIPQNQNSRAVNQLCNPLSFITMNHFLYSIIVGILITLHILYWMMLVFQTESFLVLHIWCQTC